MADLFRWVPGSDGDDLKCKMDQKVGKKRTQIILFLESWAENGRTFLETGSGRVWGSKRRLKGRLGGPGEGRTGPKLDQCFRCGPNTVQKIGHHPGDPVHSG